MKVCKNMKPNILSLSLLGLLAGCTQWTAPENISYRRIPSEKSYALIREYKQSEHNIMMLTLSTDGLAPSSRNAHLTSLPDSADYICVRMLSDTIHSVIAAEIPEVFEQRGTRTLLHVDYSQIREEWTALTDEGTAEDESDFFARQTSLRLSRSLQYGFTGVIVSYQGKSSEVTAQTAFMEEVKKFHSQNPQMEMVFRGAARNVIDAEFLGEFAYTVIISGDSRQLSLLPGRILGSDVDKSRVVIEVSVPSSETPVQEGMSPQEAAMWLLGEKNNRSFTPRGLCVGNAEDNYYAEGGDYADIRSAISIMNSEYSENE